MIKEEANNDAGLAAHILPGRWATNCVHFQLAMMAYNLNCWLMLFRREDGGEQPKTCSVGYEEGALALFEPPRFADLLRAGGHQATADGVFGRGLFQRLMKRLREITNGPAGFLPVLATPLSG